MVAIQHVADTQRCHWGQRPPKENESNFILLTHKEGWQITQWDSIT